MSPGWSSARAGCRAGIGALYGMPGCEASGPRDRRRRFRRKCTEQPSCIGRARQSALLAVHVARSGREARVPRSVMRRGCDLGCVRREVRATFVESTELREQVIPISYSCHAQQHAILDRGTTKATECTSLLLRHSFPLLSFRHGLLPLLCGFRFQPLAPVRELAAATLVRLVNGYTYRCLLECAIPATCVSALASNGCHADERPTRPCQNDSASSR
jgi:hypothetical protein